MDTIITILGFIGVAGYLAGFWYIVKCYSTRYWATLLTVIVLLLVIHVCKTWANKPTEQEIRKHTYKTLHI